MIALVLAGAALLAAPTAAPAQRAADTTRYVVLNHGRPAGEMTVARAGDSVVVRYRHVDRNRGVRTESRYRLAPDGSVRAAEIRRVGLEDGAVSPPHDSFEMARDSVRWTGAGVRGAAHRDSGYYLLRGGTAYDRAMLARWLLTRPGRATRIFPTATARLEIVGDTTVRTAAGPVRARLAAVHGQLATAPGLVWIDERGELLASEAEWFITVREGAEAALPAFRAKELAYRAAQGEALARRLAPPPAGAIAIVNGDLFDAESATVRPRTTIVVRGDRIVAVGPADRVAVPPGATVIDAAGKTVIPGLWEMHGHLSGTAQSVSGLQQLAQGITTVRDLASDTDVALSHRDRSAAGTILAPRHILGGIIEGPGAWAGPTDVLVRTEAEARAVVARYDSLGYKQVKLYNLVHPDLVPTIVEEAHRRGIRVSGHVPRGLSTPTAVRLGFDEINHAAFLFSTFFPDSLYTPRMRPYSGVASIVAGNVDVNGAAMTEMIELFRQRGTVIDGTFTLWVQNPGSTPSTVGLPQNPAAAQEAANANWLRLVKRLFDAGVTIVAGTDAQGSATFVNELELYERAGIPTPKILQLATLGAARVMKDERDHGSIAAGKVADIAIIDGKPAERIADLRRVHRVLRAGKMYDPKALLAALSAAPR